MIKIAVDAMGGDYAPKEQVQGSMEAIRKLKDVEIVLYGDPEAIKPYLTDDTRITIEASEGVISMGEKDPIGAIRNNRKSSMAMSLSSVRKGPNDAVVSSGATQALIAGAHLLVGRMKTMKRTAIAPVLPTVKEQPFILLDAGGNIEIKPEFMVQQAQFASVYAEEILGIENPQVGLINIGSEEGKGRDLDKQAAEHLKASPNLSFYGNVEPKEILDPPVPILISDGFTANIVMKTIEGTAKGMGTMLKQELKKGVLGKMGLLFSASNLKRFKTRMSPSEIGGAMIMGLRSPVIKAQGASKQKGFANAIVQAATIVRQDVIGKVSEKLGEGEERA